MSETKTEISYGIHSVMVIIVGNGYSNQSSKSQKSLFAFYIATNTLEEATALTSQDKITLTGSAAWLMSGWHTKICR